MRVVCGVGFVVRLAVLCLAAGLALGFCLGIRAVGDTYSGSTRPDGRSYGGAVLGPREEVSAWSRTSTSSCSAGCSASSAE